LVWWVFVTSFRVDFKKREKRKDGSSHEEEENVRRWTHCSRGFDFAAESVFKMFFIWRNIKLFFICF
jgi:hypothetical protein